MVLLIQHSSQIISICSIWQNHSVADPRFPRRGGAPNREEVYKPNIWQDFCRKLHEYQTRMHSSRMRTTRSSSHPPWMLAWNWSPWISPLGVGLDLIPLNFPLGCGPGSDPPQFPPWVWAWIWSPSIFPLGVDLDLIPLNFPLGCGPGCDPPQFPPWVWAWRGGLLGRGTSLAGGLLGRGSPWQGISLAGGLPGRGISLAGGGSQHALKQTPRQQNDRQVQKYYLAPNFFCGR